MTDSPRSIAKIRIRRLLIGVFAVSFASSRAPAQQQPVEFNHGFANQGTAWVPTADYLRQRLQIETLTPTTPWYASFGDQSAALGNALNAWGRSSDIGLAHSNGGLVARNYVQVNGYASRINRLATIGTPHRGAPIAENVINGRLPGYFGSLAFAIGNAGDFYANNDPDWNSPYPVVNYGVQTALNIMYYAGATLSSNRSLAGLGIAAAFPVTQQERPIAPFIGQINSSGGLGTEAAVLRRRVGISTQVYPPFAFCSIVSSNVGGCLRTRAYAQQGALSLYFYYSEHPNWWLAAHAEYWLDVYWYLRLIDVAWHDFIGALTFDQYGYPLALPSDGFIPESSSRYPAANIQYVIPLSTAWISHTEQKDHPTARGKFESVLITEFGVTRRPTTTNPPPDECVPKPGQITCAV